MRIELIYAPGCSSYRRARHTLETVIAEEGLPVSIESVEEPSHRSGAPTMRINGKDVQPSPIPHQIEHVREAICRHWKEITEKPMSSLTL